MEGHAWFAIAVGVCENPEARPPVIESEGTSRNFKRWEHFVVATLQVRYHRFEPRSIEPTNVLNKDVSWTEPLNNSVHRRPEPAVIVRAASLPCAGGGEWLTRDSPTDEVNRSEVVSSDIMHVQETRNVGPVLLQNTITERINLYLPGTLHPGTLKSEIHATDPSEQATESHLRVLRATRIASRGGMYSSSLMLFSNRLPMLDPEILR